MFHTVATHHQPHTQSQRQNQQNQQIQQQKQQTTPNNHQPDKQELHEYRCDRYGHGLKSRVLIHLQIRDRHLVGSEALLVLEKDSCDYFDAPTTTNHQPDKQELHEYRCDHYGHGLKSRVFIHLRIWAKRQVGFEA
jgi:hypothetical protein